MPLPVELSRRAKADIVRNAFWWAEHHSVPEALEWESEVTTQLVRIGNSPESYGLFDSPNDYPVQLREALVGKGRRRKYRAVFRVEEERVVIVRLYSGEETASELLEEDL